MKFNNLQEAYHALDVLKLYVHARIDLNNFGDPWFPTFEEAYKSISEDPNRSILVPHFCKSYHVVGSKVVQIPAVGIGSKDLPEVIGYQEGNFRHGKWFPIGPFRIMKNADLFDKLALVYWLNTEGRRTDFVLDNRPVTYLAPEWERLSKWDSLQVKVKNPLPRISRVDATASFGFENTDKKPAKRIGWYDATAFVLLLASLAFLIYVLIFTL